jgi:hypothetical protein
MNSAPPSRSVPSQTHWSGEVTTAWPAFTFGEPPSYSTRSMPRRTTVTSSNSGRCPGSSQPARDTIRATRTPECPEFTRPAHSSIRFGVIPAAWMTEGVAMSLGTEPLKHPADHDRCER